MDKIYREQATKLGTPLARQLLLIYGALPLAYIVTGRLGLILAVSPGYATAVFLPAGIGVGAAFMMGAASVPGVFIGSFLLNVWTGYSVGHALDGANLGTAAIIAFASALQAGIGGAVLRRAIGYPTPLDTFYDLLVFLLLSPCICLTSATISNAGMWLAGVVKSSEIALSWMTWWGGDTLGVLVVLPVMLAFAGKPRGLWRLRIWYVVVPMVLCFGLFVSLSIQANLWEEQLSAEGLSAASLARHKAWQEWFILTTGVLSTGLLGALLMLGTGRAYRVTAKQEELETVLGGTPFMLVRCGRDLRYRFVSASCAQMLGRPAKEIVGRTIAEIVGNEALKVMLPHIEQVLAGKRAEYENEIVYKGAGARIVHVIYEPDRNEEGEVIGWVASIRDVTDRREAQKRERALLMEVQHRSNNLLAIVQSIAHRSFANGHSLADAKKTFEARLQALAKTNRQLTKSNWRGIGLREIVRLETEHFGGRTSVLGADVLLTPKQAEYFSLALHELATNAAKYGALSNADGRVLISWTTAEQCNSKKLVFKWQESGGPPVLAPSRHGFGTVLIKATFPDAQIDYAVEGLSCEIHVPLNNGAESEHLSTASSPFQHFAPEAPGGGLDDTLDETLDDMGERKLPSATGSKHTI